jgi:hypothetical protein
MVTTMTAYGGSAVGKHAKGNGERTFAKRLPACRELGLRIAEIFEMTSEVRNLVGNAG